MKLHRLFLLSIVFVLCSAFQLGCKKENINPVLDSTAVNISEATVSCDPGILINGCFADDSANFTYPDYWNIKNVKYIHKNRDILRVKTDSATSVFSLQSIQTFTPGTYYFKIRIPKNTCFGCAIDFVIPGAGRLGIGFEIDTSSTTQIIEDSIIVSSAYAGPPLLFFQSCSGVAPGVFREDYIQITKK